MCQNIFCLYIFSHCASCLFLNSNQGNWAAWRELMFRFREHPGSGGWYCILVKFIRRSSWFLITRLIILFWLFLHLSVCLSLSSSTQWCSAARLWVQACYWVWTDHSTLPCSLRSCCTAFLIMHCCRSVALCWPSRSWHCSWKSYVLIGSLLLPTCCVKFR